MINSQINPQELNSLIAYQTGSVVSREIYRSDSGTLTLFAFDAGQGLSTHKTVYDATVIILDGSAKITVDDTTHNVNSGETLFMPANHPHSLQADKQFKMLLIMIKAQ